MTGDDRELRRMRLEARANLEEAEAAVAEVAAASRTMNDIIGDLGRLGITVVVDIPGRQIHGKILHVGKEVARLATVGGDDFDIAIQAIAGIRANGDSDGPAKIGIGHPDSMIARLRELTVNQERVTLGRYFADDLIGHIMVSGLNHVQLEDNQQKMWFVPVGSIAWVGPPR